MTSKAGSKKATIYIDIDDEITSIIDKVVDTKENIVALVLPKRATVLQSIVNMKLLKRSADDAKKKIVLITSDSTILPLAGISEVHVAKTLQSKPEIPAAPEIDDNSTGEVDEDIAIDKTKSIGQLAGDDDNDEETAEVPDVDEAKAASKPKKSPKKNRKLKIPNFDKFRLKLILAVLALLLLLIGWISATRVLPKAEILVKTDTKTMSKDLSVTAVLEGSTSEDTVTAITEVLERDSDQTLPATGEKNVGKRATGRLTLTNCIKDSSGTTVPKGSGFTKDGKTFVTDKAVELGPSFYVDDECRTEDLPDFYGSQKDVDVTATEGGTAYNIDEGGYNSSVAGIVAYGSKMKGGTDDVKTVVSQADIDKAREQFTDKASEGAVDELKAQLSSKNFVPFESTFKTQDPDITIDQQVDDEASSVTASGAISFEMIGVRRDQIEEQIRAAAQEDVDDSAQAISDTGINSATMRLNETSEGTYTLSIETIITIGPQLAVEEVKQQILGKKYGETESILKAKAGVVDVEISYSPFWVGATPNNPNKVTITIENIADNE